MTGQVGGENKLFPRWVMPPVLRPQPSPGKALETVAARVDDTLHRACVHPGMSADGQNYRTRRDNAHTTGEREVLYRWHPWCGRIAYIHQGFDRGTGGVFRCTLDGDPLGQCLELPVWMFDRASCQPMLLAEVPQVSVAALLALKTLLSDMAGNGFMPGQPSNAPVPGAGRSPCPENRRDADATPAPPLPHPVAGSPAIRPVPSADPGTGLEPASSCCPPTGAEPDGTAACRPQKPEGSFPDGRIAGRTPR